MMKRLLALASLLLLTGFAMFQDRLLYFPEKVSLDSLRAQSLQAWPSREDFRGLIFEPAAAARATAVVFHGNAGHAGHRAPLARALTGAGLRVVLAEYPGYGPRDGALGERSLVGDAQQTVELALRLYGAPLLVVGESLGAAVAAAACANQPERIAGLLLITPWDRLENIASHHYPWLPVRWLLNDRYDSVAHLASLARPVVVAVAEHDHIVPPAFGVALHDALPGPKRLLVIKSAGHNDWLQRLDSAWWREATDFALGARPAR